MALATARGLGHAFGAQDVFAGVTFEIQPRDRIALVGVNGAGKSTLLKILARLEAADRGNVSLPPPDRVAYLPQEVNFPAGMTLEAYLLEAFAATRLIEAQLRAIEEGLEAANTDEAVAALLDRHASLQQQLEARDGYAYEHRLHVTIAGLGIPDAHLGRDVASFSGGQRTRAALARILLGGADLLLLDEPTNHLDAESVLWLEQFLSKYEGTVVAITHDRYFLDNVAQWILELDRGRAYPYEGNYSTYLETKAARLKVEGQKDAKRAKRLAEELDLVRQKIGRAHV